LNERGPHHVSKWWTGLGGDMQLLERDELRTVLDDALATATDREGQLVVLTGEAGAG